jgi:uncharacterized protein (TIGR03437 family)
MRVKFHSRAYTVAALLMAGSHAFAQSQVVFAGRVVNAADYSGDLAPGAIVSLFGSGLAASVQSAVSLPLPTVIGASSVDAIDSTGASVPCPLYFVSPTQINLQLPYTLLPGSIQVRAHNGSAVSSPVSASLVAAAPKVFSLNISGSGQGIVADLTGRVLTTAQPTTSADFIVVYLNSMGAVDQTVAAGAAAPGSGGEGGKCEGHRYCGD